MEKIYIYTRYGLNLGGVGKILNRILIELSLRKINEVNLVVEKEMCFNFLMLSKIPQKINLFYIKDQLSYEKGIICKLGLFFIKNKEKNMLYKLIYLVFRVYDRLLNSKKIIEFFKKREIDILIDFDCNLGTKIKNIKAQEKIVWLHASPKRYQKYKMKKLKYYDKIIVISDEMRDELLEMYPEYIKKIKRIYNPIDLNEIKELGNKKIELEKETYTISIMRLETKQKDFFTLFKAFDILKKENFIFRHYIIGEGPHREIIEKKILEMKLDKNIILLGKKENPYPYIRYAKFMIHSSNYEGLPTVLIESLFLNTPIISTDCPTGPKEILDYGKEGILVSIGDSEKMAIAIKKMCEDKIFYEKLKITNEKYKDKFLMKKSIEEIISLLKEG